MIAEPHSPSSDDLSARVLQGLRSAEPAPGFEDRLLRSLTAAEATSTRPSLFARHLRWFPAWTTLTLATLGLLLVTHRISSRHIAATRRSEALAHAAGSPPVVVSQGSLSGVLPGASRTRRTRAPNHLRPFPHQEPDDIQTVAAVEAAAPSHPPPPLPITTEERQIQRFASRHTAFDLAALAPSAEIAHNAAARQAFADFFGPDVIVAPRSPPETPAAASALAPSPNPSPATR